MISFPLHLLDPVIADRAKTAPELGLPLLKQTYKHSNKEKWKQKQNTAIKTDKRDFQQGQISRTETWERVYQQHTMSNFSKPIFIICLLIFNKKLPEHTTKSVSRKVFLLSRWPHSKKLEENWHSCGNRIRSRPFDFWGAMGDLVWVRLLSPKPVNFFPQHILVFFQCNIFFPQVFLCNIFSPLKISLQDISFWNHPYPSPPPHPPFPSKVKWSAP